jgi:hypothetical protein
MNQNTVEEITSQELQATLKYIFPTDDSFIILEESTFIRTREITRPQVILLFRPDLFPYYTYILINTPIESFDFEADRDSDSDYTNLSNSEAVSKYSYIDTLASKSISLRLPLPILLFGL